MTLVELTEMIVKSLVSDPDSISVKEFPSDDEIIIEVVVKEEDMGSVIGREGKIANSIRTIVQAASFNQDNKLVKINVDSY